MHGVRNRALPYAGILDRRTQDLPLAWHASRLGRAEGWGPVKLAAEFGRAEIHAGLPFGHFQHRSPNCPWSVYVACCMHLNLSCLGGSSVASFTAQASAAKDPQLRCAVARDLASRCLSMPWVLQGLRRTCRVICDALRFLLFSDVRSSGGLEVALGSCLRPELPEVAMDQGHTIHQVSRMRHIGCIGYIGFMPEISLQLLSPGA